MIVRLEAPEAHFCPGAKVPAGVLDYSPVLCEIEAIDGVATGIPVNGQDSFKGEVVFLSPVIEGCRGPHVVVESCEVEVGEFPACMLMDQNRRQTVGGVKHAPRGRIG